MKSKKLPPNNLHAPHDLTCIRVLTIIPIMYTPRDQWFLPHVKLWSLRLWIMLSDFSSPPSFQQSASPLSILQQSINFPEHLSFPTIPLNLSAIYIKQLYCCTIAVLLFIPLLTRPMTCSALKEGIFCSFYPSS